MKLKYIVTLFFITLMSLSAAGQKAPKGWRMIWNDEFNGKSIDLEKWTVIPRGTPDWSRYMSSDPSLLELKEGNILMHGIKNPDQTTDTVRYLTAGLYSRDKFSFLYGRVEIRAKLQSVQGAWPAFWMVGAVPDRRWPDDGEIDIMEHLNFDDFIYQTVHSKYTITLGIKDNPPHGGTGKINRDDYNIYGLEWTPDALIFSTNGTETFRYPRIKTDQEGQWPFDHPFYILLDQQLGGKGTWVGEVDESQLPVTMWIDYIRVYQRKK